MGTSSIFFRATPRWAPGTAEAWQPAPAEFRTRPAGLTTQSRIRLVSRQFTSLVKIVTHVLEKSKTLSKSDCQKKLAKQEVRT